jgi:uncharacterized protein YndB with AHSA1/START domain
VSLQGSFTFESILEAPVSAVWSSLVRADRRSQWLRLPGRPGPGVPADFKPGAGETLRATATVGDTVQTLERNTQVVDVVPERRLVLVYRAVVDDQPRWASLITLCLDRPAGPDHPLDRTAVGHLTRLTWTEQYTFLHPPGSDDIAHLRGGTRLLLTARAVFLGATPRAVTEP